jgi:hypothetical protein
VRATDLIRGALDPWIKHPDKMFFIFKKDSVAAFEVRPGFMEAEAAGCGASLDVHPDSANDSVFVSNLCDCGRLNWQQYF